MTLPKRRLYRVAAKPRGPTGRDSSSGAPAATNTQSNAELTAYVAHHPAFPRIVAALLSGGDADRIGVKWVQQHVVASGVLSCRPEGVGLKQQMDRFLDGCLQVLDVVHKRRMQALDREEAAAVAALEDSLQRSLSLDADQRTLALRATADAHHARTTKVTRRRVRVKQRHENIQSRLARSFQATTECLQPLSGNVGGEGGGGAGAGAGAGGGGAGAGAGLNALMVGKSWKPSAPSRPRRYTAAPPPPPPTPRRRRRQKRRSPETRADAMVAVYDDDDDDGDNSADQAFCPELSYSDDDNDDDDDDDDGDYVDKVTQPPRRAPSRPPPASKPRRPSDLKGGPTAVTALATKYKKKSSKLPDEATGLLLKWFFAHQDNPYPTAQEKAALAKETRLNKTQIRNWFTNVRKRHWQPVRAGRDPRSMLDIAVMQLQANGSETDGFPSDLLSRLGVTVPDDAVSKP